MNLGKVRKIVLLFLIGLFIYFSYVLVLANAIAQKNKSLRATVTTLSKKLDKASAVQPVKTLLSDNILPTF
ncbi:hypothetical protein LQZ13_05645 [Leuconostoc mesenteroides]|uniref:hypothetical protein n=1 Tax=Leuconostoc mesenteroides TaxID=1245 RepID=UPI0021156772|nr:hypothetical protein [Leuconostoc mesenteroides]UUE16982.1 hypothetical protein LQZ13_05645 [Leuconostoc mesenteroides]